MIRTSILILFSAMAILVVLPWLIFWTLLTGSPDLMYRLSMGAVRFILRVIGVRVRVEGPRTYSSRSLLVRGEPCFEHGSSGLCARDPPPRFDPAEKRDFSHPDSRFRHAPRRNSSPWTAPSRESATAECQRVAVNCMNKDFPSRSIPRARAAPTVACARLREALLSWRLRRVFPIVPVSIVGARR